MRYYLYSHSNADGIFYIGKGCDNRVKHKRFDQRSLEWHEASKDGYTYKLEANGVEDDILALEKILIKSLVEQGVKLVNKFYNPKWRLSDERKKKISDNHADVSGKNNPIFGRFGKDHPNFGKKLKGTSYAQKKRWQHFRLEKANNFGGTT
jgi:hypothetical protein